MPEELIHGAVAKLRDAIHPLTQQQFKWDGQARHGDSLYARMRTALTAATNTCGAPAQASKAPTRMDILAWFVAVDSAVAEWPGPAGTTLNKLDHYHERNWNPTELRFVKAVTRNCETWAENARNILGDNPPSVPLRQKCPVCEAMWVYIEDTRQYALKATATVDTWHASCAACKTVWYTEAEQALFRRMLDTTAS